MIDARMFREVIDGRRSVDIMYDIARAQYRVFDIDYEMELHPMDARAAEIAAGVGWRAFKDFVDTAIREPTSLELLYYAQVGGPHVRGEA